MQPQGPTPEPIMQALTALWVTGAVKAGIELNLFGALAGAPLDGAALGQAIQAPARTAALLADALVGLGFLSKSNGRYGLTEVSATFLDPKKPSYFGGMARIVSSPMLWESMGDLAAAVRHGGTTRGEGTLTPDNPFWHVFAESTLAMAYGQGSALAGVMAARGQTPAKVLDIAAGTGGYGIAFAQAFPSAQVAFADWPGVLEQTKAHAERFGVASRSAFKGGDIFASDLGTGYDLVLLPNIYHHFDEAGCAALTRRVKEALAPGGSALIVDFMPDEAREKAVLPLLFGLVMVCTTPRGTVYSEGDYRRMFGAAGFTRFEALPAPGANQALLAS